MSSNAPRLVIDLCRIQDNYADLCALAQNTVPSAVLKADCYGLGLAAIAPALVEAGCKDFWVARTTEALALRILAPQANIYVLGGPEGDTLDLYRAHHLRPVLNSAEQVHRWRHFAWQSDAEPAVLHLETGFHRFALQGAEIDEAHRLWSQGALRVTMIMSHLACADDPAHPMNHEQLTAFQGLKQKFAGVRGSLSASYGFFLNDRGYRQDMVRFGRALYGIRDQNTRLFLTQPVMTLSAPIIQIAEVQRGDCIGYSTTYQALTPRRIATLAIGYADGLPRSLQDHGFVYFIQGSETYAAPITGRISMDMMCCDVTNIPRECVFEGANGFLITKEHDISRLATAAGRLDYEVMSHFGPRLDRIYLN